MSTTLDRIRAITIDFLDADPEKVTPESRFVDDLGADSLDQVEMIMAIEEEFDVEISDDEADSARTLQDVVALVEKALA